MNPARRRPAAPENGVITLTLLDDHGVVRQGVTMMLERRGFHIHSSTESAGEVRESLESFLPDVLVVDLCLPNTCGATLVREVRAAHPALKVVVFTGCDDPAVAANALHCGAHGFVTKAGGIDELAQALRAVNRGERYVDSRFKDLDTAQAPGAAALTPRETQILGLLADGLTACEVAEHLVLSRETVKTHVRNAMRRLQAKTRAQAVAMTVANAG